MAIVTVSRGSFSRGKNVAEKLARQLGYECISREILLEASEEFNIPEIKLVRAIHDAPSTLERFSHGKERYIAYIRAVLLKHVQKDNVVYHGLGGHFFLQGIPHVFKLRIIADMEYRVKEEMKRENITAEKARYILKKDDEERRKWSLQLYGMDPWDSRLYDMVLHIGNLTVDDAVAISYFTVKKPCFQTTPDSQKILGDMLLVAKVYAALVKIAPFAKVTADDGIVYISNLDNETTKKTVLSDIKSIAEKVEGVKDVRF
ncbi:MAG: cytidylate kinase-like family protein [Syntrophales bacterium]